MSRRHCSGLRRCGGILALALIAACIAAPAAAGPRERAKRMHDRLAGVPPSPAVLDSMATLLAGCPPVVAADDPCRSDALQAAYQAMQHPAFYTVSLKNFATPWTNVEQSVFDSLNDYTALVIGLVRDDLPFDQVLVADMAYVAPGVAPPYSQTDNAHYEAIERSGIDLSDPDQLVPVPQSTLPGSPLSPGDTAGVITTRAAAKAFFSAGTNRRMWRFTSMNFLCRDLEDMKDITRPADRIRQDVSRSPGGDSEIFLNHCIGCHSGLDPVAGAFAYYEWDAEQERMLFSRGSVQGKHLINANTSPYGYITVDDRWDNYWRQGPNAALGWDDSLSGGGFGPKSLGQEVATSRAFAECQVEKVFEQVCFRPPNSQEDFDEVTRIADVFEAQNRNLKRVFAETAIYCMGQ